MNPDSGNRTGLPLEPGAREPGLLCGALPPGLEGLVERSWLLSRRDCDASGRFEVFPDGNFGLGVVLTPTRCDVIAGGPITETIRPHVGNLEIHWLRFRPGRFPRIADVHPRDLVDRPGIVLDRLPGLDLDDLGERLSGTACARTRLGILGAFFGSLGSTPLCQAAVDALDGRTGVGDLSMELGMSTRMIQRVMVDQVGLTPKQLILNVRLQRAIAQLRDRGSHRRLGEVASACGYADQSHLIRDFKRLTERLPSSF